MMTNVHYMSGSDEWATPKELFEKLDAEFHFTLDPCSTDLNAKCENHYTKEQDGLSQDWGGANSFLQSTIRTSHKELGAKVLRGSSEAWHGGRAVDTSKNRYDLFSRIYLPQGKGHPFLTRTVAF